MSTFETEAVNSSLVERKIRLRADEVAALNASGQCIAIKVLKLGEKTPEWLKLIGLFRISIAPAGDHNHDRLSVLGHGHVHGLHKFLVAHCRPRYVSTHGRPGDAIPRQQGRRCPEYRLGNNPTECCAGVIP